MCQLQVWLEGGENSKRSSPQWEKQNPEGRDGVSNLRETRAQVEILTACSGGNGDSSESWPTQRLREETGSLQWGNGY